MMMYPDRIVKCGNGIEYTSKHIFKRDSFRADRVQYDTVCNCACNGWVYGVSLARIAILYDAIVEVTVCTLRCQRM